MESSLSYKEESRGLHYYGEKMWKLAKKDENVFIEKETVRSCRTKVFCKTDVLKKFAKFTGKHLCQSLFFINLQSEACNFI